MATQTISTAGSSAFARIEYDDEEETCYITFTDGRSYVLEGFPQIEFARWSAAPSKGGYWNAYVKGNY